VLRYEINAALKAAMKARDQRRVDTLRLVNSAIQNADIEATGQGKGALTDTEILALLQKLIRQRQESAEIYEKSGRASSPPGSAPRSRSSPHTSPSRCPILRRAPRFPPSSGKSMRKE
jgi:hypothetical protein